MGIFVNRLSPRLFIEIAFLPSPEVLEELHYFRTGWGTKYHLNMDFGKNIVDSFERKVGSSADNVGGSMGKVGSFANNVGGNRRGWMTREQLEQQILKCCSEYCSIEEIALSVNLSADYLKNKILSKMVQSGMLVRQHPDNLTHPLQKFKAEETA